MPAIKHQGSVLFGSKSGHVITVDLFESFFECAHVARSRQQRQLIKYLVRLGKGRRIGVTLLDDTCEYRHGVWQMHKKLFQEAGAA